MEVQEGRPFLHYMVPNTKSAIPPLAILDHIVIHVKLTESCQSPNPVLAKAIFEANTQYLTTGTFRKGKAPQT